MGDKYVVFKSKDFNAWARQMNETLFSLGHPEGDRPTDISLTEMMLRDAVVIRKQDIFAASALHAYADTIQTALEIIEQIGAPLAKSAYIKRLEETRDYFFHAAEDAAEVEYPKIPD